MRKLLKAWRYYTLEYDDYIRCINADAVNNLRLMGITGVLFAMFSVYASISFVFSYAIVDFVVPTIVFGILAVISALYAFVSLKKYEQYKHYGEQSKDHPKSPVKEQSDYEINSNAIYLAMMIGYVVIVASTVYYAVFVAPGGVPVVFVALIACAILLLPPYPMTSAVTTLVAVGIYLFVSSILVEPYCCWICELTDAGIGAIIGVVLAWYINMHKLVATHSTILMRDERDKYAARSITDELTKLHNYRDFMNRLERYLTHYRASDKYMCLAVMDIDRFKQYNDHYGHPQGDECLRLIGEALGRPWAESKGMYAARIGGEEFALLWFEEDKDSVKEIAEEIHQRIYDLQIQHEESDIAPYVTFSIGIDISHSGAYADTRAAYIAADSALYDAKANGRNNAVIMFEGERLLRLKQPIR